MSGKVLEKALLRSVFFTDHLDYKTVNKITGRTSSANSTISTLVE